MQCVLGEVRKLSAYWYCIFVLDQGNYTKMSCVADTQKPHQHQPMLPQAISAYQMPFRNVGHFIWSANEYVVVSSSLMATTVHISHATIHDTQNRNTTEILQPSCSAIWLASWRWTHKEKASILIKSFVIAKKDKCLMYDILAHAGGQLSKRDALCAVRMCGPSKPFFFLLLLSATT